MGSIDLKSDDSLELKKLFNATEYVVFGIMLPSKENKKLDIATGGEDIPELETKEEAKKD